MSVALIVPARCTGKLPDDLTNEHLVAELKLDGSRYVLYIHSDPYEQRLGNTLRSRRVSSTDGRHVDKTDNVPHITSPTYSGLDGTVLDGEVFLKDFPTTQGIMGCGPELALKKQQEAQLDFWVWDCPVYMGEDIRHRPLSERRRILEDVVRHMNNPYIRLMPQWAASGWNIPELFNRAVSDGGEGLIIKDLRLGYGLGWCKMKKSYDTSCFISGFKKGKGKYADQVGSIALSVFGGKESIEVGFASGFNDEIRAQLDDTYIGRVVDIYAQELSKDLRLRHPTFYRFREDLDKADCTLEKLRSDLSKNAKNRRKRDG